MRAFVPWTMVWFRVVLAPVMVFGARQHWTGAFLSAIVLVALLDDIFDGMLARAWKTDTPNLRLADSCADTVFYLGVAWALWIRSPELLWANKWLLAGLFAFELLRYLFDFAKFGKAASYHSYLAKAWGLVLALTVVGAFALRRLEWLMEGAIWLGMLVNAEGLTMSLMLPRWQNDVRTIAAARRCRQQMLAGSTPPDW